MGTTRIKVIDLSQEKEQIKTSRKRAVKGLIGDIKSPLVEKKKAKPVPQNEEIVAQEAISEEKIEDRQVPKEEPKATKKRSKFTRTRGMKYQNAKLLLDPQKIYPIEEALDLSKKTSYVKFDGSLEVHVVLKNNKPVRGMLTFPHSLGKERKILLFAEKADSLAKNGVALGDEKTIQKIAAGELKPEKDFDLIISTPEFMSKLATLGKILGPRGLMPNPKTGTVVDHPKEALEKFAGGQIEFKSQENAPVVHISIGKVSFETQKLKENLLAFLSAIGLPRIKKVVISPTMGPGIKVAFSQNPKN